MGGFILRHLGSLRGKAQGVGSYDTPATPVAADALEVARDGAIKYTPGFENLDTLAPRRGGQPQVLTSKTIDWNYKSRLRAFTVPLADAGVRPSVHAFLLACGYIDTHVPGPPNLIIYELQDFPEKMDSVTFHDLRGQGTNVASKSKAISGARGTLKVSADAGQIIIFDMAGKGIGYALIDGGALPDDPTPAGQILTLMTATLLLETVGGGTIYSGPLKGFGFDAAMNMQEVPDGTATGLVDEVLLQPKDNYPFWVSVQDQLLTGFNAEDIRDTAFGAAALLNFSVSIPSPSLATNVVTFQQQGSIGTVDMEDLADGAQAQKINCMSTWYDAAAPGITPAYSHRIIFQSV